MQPKQIVTFKGEDGTRFYSAPDTFLLFVDETGEESLQDPNYPIFGFGAVGLPAQIYLSNLSTPWESLKEKEFNGKNKPLHAADLRKPTLRQLEALNSFFTGCAFCRIAAVISDKTVFADELDVYNVLVRGFYERLLEMLKTTEYSNIFIIHEHSQRMDIINLDYFSRYKINRQTREGKNTLVPIESFWMKKEELAPGLEVADFVAHTAGTSVRSRLQGKNRPKDYDAVFSSFEGKLTSYMEITQVQPVN